MVRFEGVTRESIEENLEFSRQMDALMFKFRCERREALHTATPNTWCLTCRATSYTMEAYLRFGKGAMVAVRACRACGGRQVQRRCRICRCGLLDTEAGDLCSHCWDMIMGDMAMDDCERGDAGSGCGVIRAPDDIPDRACPARAYALLGDAGPRTCQPPRSPPPLE